MRTLLNVTNNLPQRLNNTIGAKRLEKTCAENEKLHFNEVFKK